MNDGGPAGGNDGAPAATLLGLGAVAVAGVLGRSDPSTLEPFLGTSPALATVVVVAGGAAALLFLRSRGWFRLHMPGSSVGEVGRLTAIALLFALPVILVDVGGGFPQDINVGLPRGLLFYPLMALIAEAVFHAIPLALVVFLFGRPLASMDRAVAVRRIAIPVALLEPGFQVGFASGDSPVWATAYVAVHVFAFNLVCIEIFRRRGFLAAYAFRVAYYACWHVAWGVLRLELLF